MRKFALFVLVSVLCLVASLSAVSADDGDGLAWVCPAGLAGKTLRMLSWSTYIAEDTIPNFEAACDVRVEYYEMGSYDEMVASVDQGAGAYDIAMAIDYVVTEMTSKNLLRPLNRDLIPNFSNLDPAFVGLPYDAGNTYAIPYVWGTVGIGYDANVVSQPLTSWADFFAYAGRVAWLDDARAMLGVMLKLNGYDPNTSDEAALNAAVDAILESTANEVFQIAPDNGQDLLLRGEVDAVVEYGGDILQLEEACACADYVFVLPAEGMNYYVDNMVIPFNAPEPELAHAFIDYILEAQVGADLVNAIRYGSPNAAAMPLIDPEMRDNPLVYPSADYMARSWVTEYKGAAEQFYAEAWNRVNIALTK
jgi:spermidine/putrescine transport system substrate-binding protein